MTGHRPSARTVITAVATLIFVAACWVPSFSLAQSRRMVEENSRHIGEVDDRANTTEWLLDRTEDRLAKIEDSEDKRFAAIEIRVTANERQLQHSREVEAIASTMATFMRWVMGILVPMFAGALWWAAKWLGAWMKTLSKGHSSLRDEVVKSRQVMINVLSHLMTILEKTDPKAAGELAEDLQQLKREGSGSSDNIPLVKL